jgi:peptide/nickel transport system ATP-binding protein
MDKDILLDVRGLKVDFAFGSRPPLHALHDVSFQVRRGSIVGIVGESGSGKSLTAKALMRMLPAPGRIVAGTIAFDGLDLGALSEREMRAVRGRRMSMVFQDPQTALNPVKSIGWQIREALTVHGATRAEADERALDLLRQVGIPDPETRFDEYPHEFSGGMRQRVVIASAIANAASLIIADEPTTALDVTIQAQILRLLARLRDSLGTAVLLITHDMGVVAELCDEVVVMYGGRVVERGAVETVFAAPQHPYTQALLAAMPRVDRHRAERLSVIPGTTPDLSSLPSGCAFHPRCAYTQPICRTASPPLIPSPTVPAIEAACHFIGEIGASEPATEAARSEGREAEASAAPILQLEDVAVDFGSKRRLLRREKPFYAVDGVSLELRPGETVGLVGESGCGKTTVSRAIVGINPTARGAIRVKGQDVTRFTPDAAALVRDTVQYIFQDPYASLNPRLTVRQILFEALDQRRPPVADRETEAQRLLQMVGLDQAYLDRYPKAFSGGQRQRIGIARALAVEPEVLVCDEPVSALDVSIQAQVINILSDLRDRLGLAILFIAHDLAVVRHLSDRIVVMYLGKVVEEGPVEAIYAAPRHPYTAVLIASTPQPDATASGLATTALLDGDPPNPRNPPSGCRFRTRCPIGPVANPDRRICVEVEPPLAGESGHRAACHFPDEAAAVGRITRKPT